MDVTALHQTKHLAGIAADLQGFAVEFAGEGIQGHHDVADCTEAVISRVRRLGFFWKLPYARIGFPHHFLAEINAYQIILEYLVVEHILRAFTQICYPFGNARRLESVGHVLRINRAGRMDIAANATNATR